MLQIDKIRGPLMHKHRAGDIGGLTEIIREILPTSITNNTYNEVTNVSVVWITGFTFNISNVTYTIQGNTYHAPDITIILAPADVTHPRYDVIVVNNFGDVIVIQGTPGAIPVIPPTDPATQTIITIIYIPAGATEPGTDPGGQTGTLVTEKIYDENIEWTTSKIEEASTAIDFEDAVLPNVGVKCIKITMNDPAAAGAWVNAGLVTYELNPTIYNFNLMAPGSTFDIMAGNIYTDNKTDRTEGLTRHLRSLFIKNKTDIKGIMTNTTSLVDYPVTVTNYLRDFWAVADVNYSQNAPGLVSFRSPANLPAGNYNLWVDGFWMRDQQYTAAPALIYTPAGTLAKFTRAAGVIDAKGGNLSFDLRTDKAFLINSGFIIELFNGAVKVGSRTLVPGVNMYGFNGAILTEWQRVTIPIADFNCTSTLVTVCTIRPINEYPNNVNLGIDNIILQTGGQVLTPEELNPLVYTTDWEFPDITKDVAQTYVLDLKAAFDYKILSVVLQSDSTMDDMAIKINGTAITGLAAVDVTAGITETAATALNIVKKGDQVTMVTSGVDGSPTLIRGKFNYIRL